MPNKNVHRYGETTIKHVDRPMRPDEWKKSARARNAGRPLPDTPREIDYEAQRVASLRRQRLQKQAPVASEGESIEEQAPPPQSRQTHPVKADFFISVPIFNETLSHSYRKKNEYVYVERGNEDTVSLYHQSLSRSSSTKDLTYERPPSGARQDRTRRRVKSGSLSNRSQRSHSHDGHGYYTRERQYVDHHSDARLDRSLERRRYDTDRDPRLDRSLERRRYDTDRDSRLNRSFERRNYDTDRSATERQRLVLSDRQQYGVSSRKQNVRPRSERQYSSHRQNYMSEEKLSKHQGVPRPLSERRRRPYSGSEASFNTMTSTGTGHSYIHEEMPAAFKLRKAPSTGGLEIDSDQDDTR